MSFDDERVRFYMKHRDQIDEWAALRGTRWRRSTNGLKD
jgi:hypothetical protein